MPRIKANWKAYKVTDFRNWITGEMKDQHIKQYDMAEALGISQQQYSKKLKEMNFRYTELLIILEELNADSKVISKYFLERSR